MSVLKFECPGCGQHMECDRACAGDIIHCPRCCAELRIPFSEMPGSILRAEMILHAPKAPAPAPSVPAPAPAPPRPVEVICPVCESQLRVRSGASKVGAAPPLAELIKRGEPKPHEAEKVEESHPDLAHMSVQEREQHIAAAREAHPIQLHAPVKPRLSYVLSEQAAPVTKPPDGEQQAGSGEQPPNPPNSFSE
jgi:hypothetical protein